MLMRTTIKFSRKCFLSVCLTLVLCVCTSTTVFANVGMIYSADREASEFFVDNSHPLIVESERLTFDVHSRNSFTSKKLWSDVKADYQVTNPTAEAVEVQALFPVVFLQSRNSGEPNTHDVRFDGQALDFEICFAEVLLDTFEDMQFAELLSQLGTSGHEDPNLVLIVFTLRVEPYQTGRLEIFSVTSAHSDHSMIESLYMIFESEYSFQYFLSPAKHWADFKNLTITIHAPVAAPFLIDSSFDFQLSGFNTFTAHYDSLPDGNLTFTLKRSVPYSVVLLTSVILLWKLGEKAARKWNQREKASKA